MQFFWLWFVLFCSAPALDLTYGRFTNKIPLIKTSKTLDVFDLIALAAKYSPKMQEIHIKQLNESFHEQTERKLLQPILELSTSIQKNENVDSDLANIQMTSNWKNSYGGA